MKVEVVVLHYELLECVLNISTTTLILFLKPLFYLNRIQNDRYLHDLIIKVSLLNGIMILSDIRMVLNS